MGSKKTVVVVMLFVLSGAVLAISAIATQPASQPADAEHEAVELAPFMGNIQRFSQKLGYSLAGQNGKLAAFYLEEIRETIDEVKEKVPVHDGLPIARTSEIIFDPTLEPLEQSVKAGDWQAAGERYRTMIDSCNRCHAATEHEFIVILPASGTPPFNQKF